MNIQSWGVGETPRRDLLATLACALLAPPISVFAQSSAESLEGMWSDPPATPEDRACFFYCTQVGLDYLETLLNDPKNDERPFGELLKDVDAHEIANYFKPRLSEAALATFPLDELKDDEGYLHCVPWGLAWQFAAPHQIEIRRAADRVEMHYGEWDARRTVYLDGRALPESLVPTPLGYSVGHFDGDALVVETRGITANAMPWNSKHSDQLEITERYVRDGDRLRLTAILRDPWGLREPVELMKVWSWAPDQEIFPYDQCKPAAESAEPGSK